MPLTFPSHAAAALPLHWAAPERLWLVPLIVGTCTPDVAYALRWSGGFSHTLAGVALFCVPAGAVIYVVLEALILPALAASIPPLGRLDLAALVRTRGLPSHAGAWCWAVVSIALGALTHLAWDAFTHREAWPARVLYPDAYVALAGFRLHLANLLQYASTVAGAAAVAAHAWRRVPRVRASPPGQRSWARLALLATAAGAGAMASCVFDARDFAVVGWKDAVWLAFFFGMRGAFVGLAVASAALLGSVGARARCTGKL